MINSEVKNLEKERIIRACKKAIFFNKAIITAMYIISFLTIFIVFNLESFIIQPLNVISLGAVMAGFGSAFISLATLWEKDNLIRVKENVEILYNGIFKVSPWKRWPFISRFSRFKLYSKIDIIEMPLFNPRLLIDVGIHKFEVDVPTVQEDFFDLPVLKNYLSLLHYKRMAENYFARMLSTVSEQEQEKRAEENENEIINNLSPWNKHMMYVCLLDIWHSVFVFRISRYGIHYGSGIVLWSVIFVLFFLLK